MQKWVVWLNNKNYVYRVIMWRLELELSSAGLRHVWNKVILSHFSFSSQKTFIQWEIGTARRPTPAQVADDLIATSIRSGVDWSDQLRSSCTFVRKYGKWGKKLFFYLFDMCITNSYTMHKEAGGNRTLGEFKLELVTNIISSSSLPVYPLRGRPQSGPSPLRLKGRHFAEKIQPPENLTNEFYKNGAWFPMNDTFENRLLINELCSKFPYASFYAPNTIISRFTISSLPVR